MTDAPIYILRHGETVWNVEGRLQGRADSPLTENGRMQAASQGVLLKEIFRDHPEADVLCSTAGRARETLRLALVAAGAAARPVRYLEALQEIDLGEWQGRLMSEIGDGVPGTPGALGWTAAAPGGEGQAALMARSAEVLRGLTGPSVIMTHGVTSLALRGQLLGLDTEAIAGLSHRHGVVYALQNGAERVLEGA